jgi:hypothetical protein
MSAILAVPPQNKKQRMQTSQRPSLLDPFLNGDPWMASSSLPGLLVLDLSNYPIALQKGTTLDQASLNALIFRLRTNPVRAK